MSSCIKRRAQTGEDVPQGLKDMKREHLCVTSRSRHRRHRWSSAGLQSTGACTLRTATSFPPGKAISRMMSSSHRSYLISLLFPAARPSLPSRYSLFHIITTRTRELASVLMPKSSSFHPLTFTSLISRPRIPRTSLLSAGKQGHRLRIWMCLCFPVALGCDETKSLALYSLLGALLASSVFRVVSLNTVLKQESHCIIYVVGDQYDARRIRRILMAEDPRGHFAPIASCES